MCCSSGFLPDPTSSKNSDGTCATYTVKSGDYCALVANRGSGPNVGQISQFSAEADSLDITVEKILNTQLLLAYVYESR